MDAFRQALRLLWAHKLRSALTLFGLIWGTASVILLVAWGEGVRLMLEDGFEKTGRNMGQVWAGTVSEEFTPAVDRRNLWYTIDDVEALRARAHLADLVGSEKWDFLPAAFGGRVVNADVRGIDPQVMEIRGLGVSAGRGITHDDIKHRRRVALLGADLRKRLFGARGRLGDVIRLGGKPFRVVGFIERVGMQLDRDRTEIDLQLWIPISTHHANWPVEWTQDLVVDKILYRLVGRHLVDDAELEVRAILAERLRVSPHDDEAVGIWSTVEFLRDIPLDRLKGTLGVLASATLLIGGIGILTMMLDSVQERRQEIGIRLAVGAKRRDVVLQFFLETATLTALGGGLGVALGVGSCVLLERVSRNQDMIPVPQLGLPVVLIALSVLSFVGLTSGWIPARKAAQIDPAQSLRMD